MSAAPSLCGTQRDLDCASLWVLWKPIIIIIIVIRIIVIILLMILVLIMMLIMIIIIIIRTITKIISAGSKQPH